MVESLKYNGYWKYPESDQWTVPGELTFSTEGGIQFNGIGSFGSKEEHGRFENKTVHGFTTNGIKVTLLNCKGSFSTSTPGLKIVRLNAEHIILGDYFKSPDEISFETIAVHYHYLDEWVDKSGFDVHEEEDATGKETKVLTYTQPDLIELYTGPEKDVLLWFSYASPMVITDTKVNSFTQKVYFNIIYKEPKGLELVKDDVGHIKNFITFGLSRITAPTDLIGYYKNSVGEKKKVQIIYGQKFYPDRSDRYLHTNTCLFTFEHIESKSKTIFKEWFLKYETLAPVFDRYFDTIYNHYLYEVNHFLNLISALETYHRRTSEETYFDVDYYKALKIKIKDVLPEGDKKINDWFGKFEFMNEVSLRNRLKKVCEKFNDIFLELEPETKTFINKVLATRNYYTHYNERLRADIVTKIEFRRYNGLLNVLIQLCLLSELGFETKEMKEAIKRNINNWGLLKD